jgi:hypothetical protein
MAGEIDTHRNTLASTSQFDCLRVILMANMQFPLPEASVMLRFLQRNRRVFAERATLTQKPCNDKHGKIQ